MLRVLWNSRSGMIANQEKLDAISNNLANVNTNGYKRVTVSFQDTMSETLRREGYPVSQNAERAQDPYTGTGVKTSGWMRDNKQGNLIETNKETDFAIDGEGYFQLTRADGTVVYTRVGQFDVDANQNLVDPNGNRVTIEPAPGVDPDSIKFIKGNYSISKNGEVFIKEGNQYNLVGSIPLFTANGSDDFISIGENYYQAKPGVQVYQVEDADICQGYLEGSNVDLAAELTDMIVTQRAFQLGTKGLQAADEMWQMANNLKSR
ncbi:MAG: flagellar basal body rod protein FlgG [Clostridiales bacterium]|mgnify:CR=1 FL=1|uniref:flagellar hook-basal body complex protein n=1 Tax=Clostridium sp. N3C TaxID=1776758 RepID=UPI00092DFBC5|nr:flagellar hook-basal body complex protein [Clostridium sp. N3C]NLZ48089.1 flagellar basal body rod protein FlgG [Clostridiales bacterium]SCN21327.1 Distal rod protein [Clostridium sp. N3C]